MERVGHGYKSEIKNFLFYSVFGRIRVQGKSMIG